MNRRLTSSKSIWLLLLFGLFIVLSSCTKDLNESAEGEAKTFNDMVNIFVEIVPHLNPENVELNDWIFLFQKGLIMVNRTEAEIVIDRSVFDVEDTSCGDYSGRYIQFKEVRQEKIDGKVEEFNKNGEDCIVFDKNYLLALYSLYFSAPEGVTNSFYNVKFNVTKELAPQGVVDQGCQGMPSCEIRVFNVEFQQKLLYPDGEEALYFKQLKISPDVPFLARDLSYCISLAVDIGDTSVPIKQCLEVRNFGKKN